MEAIELCDEKVYPDESVLKVQLGTAYCAYADLLTMFAKNELKYEWRYYKDGKAWLCKVQKNKKTILWMSALKDYIKACIYIPERLIEDMLNLEISETLKEQIINTKNFGKSKPCLFEVRTSEILTEIEIIMNYKIKAQ